MKQPTEETKDKLEEHKRGVRLLALGEKSDTGLQSPHPQDDFKQPKLKKHYHMRLPMFRKSLSQHRQICFH